MKLVTYRAGADEAGRLGVLHADMVVDVEWLGDSIGQAFPAAMLDLIDLGPDALMALRARWTRRTVSACPALRFRWRT